MFNSLHLEHTDFGGICPLLPQKGSLLIDKGNRLLPDVHHVTAQKIADALLHGHLQPLHERLPNFVAWGSKDSHCNATLLQIMVCIIPFYKYLKTIYIWESQFQSITQEVTPSPGRFHILFVGHFHRNIPNPLIVLIHGYRCCRTKHWSRYKILTQLPQITSTEFGRFSRAVTGRIHGTGPHCSTFS